MHMLNPHKETWQGTRRGEKVKTNEKKKKMEEDL
jgi:hypothetical protein